MSESFASLYTADLASAGLCAAVRGSRRQNLGRNKRKLFWIGGN